MQSFACIVATAFVRGGQKWTPSESEGEERVIRLNARDARTFYEAGLVTMKPATLEKLEAFEASLER